MRFKVTRKMIGRTGTQCYTVVDTMSGEVVFFSGSEGEAYFAARRMERESVADRDGAE